MCSCYIPVSSLFDSGIFKRVLRLGYHMHHSLTCIYIAQVVLYHQSKIVAAFKEIRNSGIYLALALAERVPR